jgi:hypothetical protein
MGKMVLFIRFYVTKIGTFVEKYKKNIERLLSK